MWHNFVRADVLNASWRGHDEAADGYFDGCSAITVYIYIVLDLI